MYQYLFCLHYFHQLFQLHLNLAISKADKYLFQVRKVRGHVFVCKGYRFFKKRKEILATCLSESILPKIKNALVDTRDFLVLVGTQQNTALSEHFQNPVEAKSIPLTHKYMTSHPLSMYG
jgi:hypothetical protein